jgi:hypothetical protein
MFFLIMPVTATGAEFPYGHYEALLKQHVKTGVIIDGIRLNAVDYAAIRSESKRPDSNYSLLLKELATFDPSAMINREEKIAFWVNVYNIGAMKTIVDHYPVDSIRSRKIHWLGLPWSRKVINVGGREYSLTEIEYDILLDGFKDLRIHFGINCASVSCADLLPVPYRANGLFSQLEEQGRKLLADPKKGMRIDEKSKGIYLSQIFKFDKKHFDAFAGGVLPFLKTYLNAVDRNIVESGGMKLDYLGYDWSVNDSKNAR